MMPQMWCYNLNQHTKKKLIHEGVCLVWQKQLLEERCVVMFQFHPSPLPTTHTQRKNVAIIAWEQWVELAEWQTNKP